MIITINKRKITVPQSWNELSLKQQYNCYDILMTDTHQLFETHELLPTKRILLMMRLVNIDDQFVKDWLADCIQFEGEEQGSETFLDEMNGLLEVTNFLFHQLDTETESESLQYEINLGLTKCPYPFLMMNRKIGKVKQRWHAPADELANLTIYELGVTFTLFENFLKSKDEELAEELLATLFRRAKPNTKANKQSGFQGDIRLPYLHHESMVKKRMIKIRTIPKATKQLLLFWFACCRQAIIEKYPNVFVKGGGESDKQQNDYGWGAVILNLADGLVHLDQVAQQRYSNALAYLSYLEDQRKLRELKELKSK